MPDFDFLKTEEKILRFWADRKIFERSLEARKYARRFVFFEGPPTANGKPGIHHFLGRALKDLFVRYKTMRGYLVERKAGWDTHGLPVEIEVEKQLGLKNKKEIEKYGIREFNAKAKQNVWQYKDEWENFTRRIGYWLDLGNPYITYDPEYVESLWWIISEISKRKLLYEGHKVLPWCPRCGTALSSHEVAQGYEEVTEKSVYAKFKVKSGQKIDGEAVADNTYLLAWTTTPWTLPGNVALAIGEKLSYVIAEKDGVNFVVAKDLAEKVVDGGKIIKEIKGKDLVGVEYESLFDIEHLQSKTAYKVYTADFVTTGEGTGVVHTAVMYGEDDYQLGVKLGLPKHHTVDPDGKFTKEVKEFEGQFVKDAEPGIIEHLKNRGLLFKVEPYTHSYPHCWRCHSPLLYYARDSWFVAMSKLRKQLIKNNKKINWVPEHLKDGRFGEFIKDVKDWAFSRERYWGTPLPVWHCTKCKNQKVIGSFKDLEENRYRPKNTYYILRHGLREGAFNDSHQELTASQLQHDTYDLIPEGITQIEGVAEHLNKIGGVDYVFASPFLRTRHTAQIIADKFNHKVIIDDRLKEIDHGMICEGKIHNSCVPPNTKPAFDTKYGDGESWRDVKNRVFSLFEEVDKKYEGKKIIFVSHGDPLWIMEGITRGMGDKELVAWRTKHHIKPGELREIDFKNYPYNEKGELDPHRPYVDAIELKCSKCGEVMKRAKEVVDVWFDSGAMPYAQWHYPFSAKGGSAFGGDNKRNFALAFPANFIAEAIDQTRGWFYTLLAVSTLLGKGAPYKNVISHGHVLDEKGKKMSKSVGNVVNPWDVIEKFGVDATRWYFYTLNHSGDPKLFALNDVGKKLNGFITTVLNSLRFFELYGEPLAKRYKATPKSKLDYWILSRLNTVVRNVIESVDNYDATVASREIEKFAVEDFSNWWIRRSRKRFQRPSNKEDLQSGLAMLRHLLVELSKIIAPFTPFLAEHIYKKLDNRKESVHLEDWPRPKRGFVDVELEKQMSELREIIAAGLAIRKQQGIKVRQPLASISIKKETNFDSELELLALEELNIKKINYDASQDEVVKFDTQLTNELIMEGYAREIMRQIQDMRKDAKYKLDAKVYAAWESDNANIARAISQYSNDIVEDTVLKEFVRGQKENEIFDVKKEFELGSQAKIWLGVRAKK